MYTLCKALLISAISSLILACGGGGTITSALPATDESSATVLFPDDSPSDVAQSEVEQPEQQYPSRRVRTRPSRKYWYRKSEYRTNNLHLQILPI